MTLPRTKSSTPHLWLPRITPQPPYSNGLSLADGWAAARIGLCLQYRCSSSSSPNTQSTPLIAHRCHAPHYPSCMHNLPPIPTASQLPPNHLPIAAQPPPSCLPHLIPLSQPPWQMDGRLPAEAFEECVQLAIDGCKAVAAAMRKTLVSHTKALMAAGAGGGVRT